MAKNVGKPARKALAIEDRFEIGEDGVATAPRAELRGTIYEVTERSTGDEFCLKLWRKSGTPADAELRELWRHEMRHVQRVMAHSGARGVIVNLVEFLEDDNDFGVVMEKAGRPLSILRSRVNGAHWLRALAIPAHRARLWRNVRRLVLALGIVHDQGLVHGRMGEDVVFSEGSMDPDFRLSGFEWSLWLDGERRLEGTRRADGRPDEAALSFAEDWAALGNMVCRLLGITFDAAGTPRAEAGREMPVLTARELRWLRRTCRPRSHEPLEAHGLARACDEIVVELVSVAGQWQGRCTLLLPRSNGIADAIYDTSGGTVPRDERNAQKDFVSHDLDNGVTLYAPRSSEDDVRHLYLVTPRLVYRLRAISRTAPKAGASPFAIRSKRVAASCRSDRASNPASWSFRSMSPHRTGRPRVCGIPWAELRLVGKRWPAPLKTT